MRAAIYCRVSTEDQEREGTSLKTQLEACLRYCKDKGYEITKTFSETYSGLTRERPFLGELREMVRGQEVDRIIIYCLDRWVRDPTDGVILQEELDRSSVILESVTETIENTELGKFLTYTRGFAAKLEASKIKERTMRGKMSKVKAGKLCQGTGIGIYGYKMDKTIGRRVIVEHEAEIVRQVFGLALSGSTPHQIAVQLNQDGIPTKSGSKWAQVTIKRMLRGEAYAGRTYFNQSRRISKTKVIARPKEEWIALPDITPAIVDEETFNRAQQALEDCACKRPIKKHSPYLLSGILFCSKCGSRIGGTSQGGKYRYYQCRGARPTYLRAKFCECGYIRAENLEDIVWQEAVKLASSPMTLVWEMMGIGYDSKKHDAAGLLDKQIAKLHLKLKAYPAKEKNFLSLLMDEKVTREYVLEMVSKIKAEEQRDQDQLKKLTEDRAKVSTVENATLKLSEMSKVLGGDLSEVTDPLQKRAVLEALMVKVIAEPGKYSIKYFMDAELDNPEAHNELFRQQLGKFEKLHPEYTAQDIADFNKALPEDTAIGRVTNRAKGLVTTRQTSGYLLRYGYNPPPDKEHASSSSR